MKKIFINAMTKTKNAMTKILSFLKEKRFSLITFIISLILCLDIYSCVVRPTAREPTTANAESSFYEYSYHVPLYYKFYGSQPVLIDTQVVFRNNGNYLVYTVHQSNATTYESSIANFEGSNALTINNVAGYLGNSMLGFSITLSLNIIKDNIDDITHLKVTSTGFDLMYIGVGTQYTIAQLTTNIPTNNAIDEAIPLYYSSFSDAYDFGYDAGYDVGYDAGYDVGLNVNFNDVSPFEVISSGVDSFLSIELFNGVSIGTILLIAFGFIMIGVLLKVFLGG